MKAFFLAILFAQAITIFGQPLKSSQHLKKAGQIITDLNNDHLLDTIKLFFNSDDPGLYKKIEILIAGGERKDFYAKNGWVNVDPKFLKTNRNAIQSDKLFVYKSNGTSAIFLFGSLDGAGYREDFAIINIIDNKPKLIFNHDDKSPDIEIPISISDLNNDGHTQFVFRNFFEFYQQVDSLKADIAAYSPYLVYTIGENFRLNKPLTKAYNEKHYVFAGFEYSEKIKVLVPRNGGKPKIVN